LAHTQQGRTALSARSVIRYSINMKNRKLISLIALGPILMATGFAFAENTAYDQLKGSGDTQPQAAPIPSFSASKSIYGDNSMQEYYQVPEQLKRLADSSVAFVSKKDLYFDPAANVYRAKYSASLSEVSYVDASEDFSSQTKLSGCSGAYLGKGLVMTAGHCVYADPKDPKHFENFFMVFGWKQDQAGVFAQEFPPDSVYSISKVQVHAHEGPIDDVNAYRDFALVSMDREPAGRQPLPLELEQTPKTGQKVFTIGYPLGLAVKINNPDHAQVYAVGKNVFQSNIDAFGGNSGGPAFDSATNKIIGIVVTARGADYSYELKQDFGFIAEFTLPTDDMQTVPHLGTVYLGAAVKENALKLFTSLKGTASKIDETKYLVTLPKGSKFQTRSLPFKMVTGVAGINVFNKGWLMRDKQESFGTGVTLVPEEIKNIVRP